MAKKPVAKFKKFPEELFVTSELDGDTRYFVLWEDLKDAIESDSSKDSEIARYYFSESGEGKLNCEATL